MNEKKKKRYKGSKKLPRGTPLSSLGYWLAVASPRSLGLPGPECHLSSTEQRHWDGMTSVVWWGLSLLMVLRELKRSRSNPRDL